MWLWASEVSMVLTGHLLDGLLGELVLEFEGDT